MPANLDHQPWIEPMHILGPVPRRVADDASATATIGRLVLRFGTCKYGVGRGRAAIGGEIGQADTERPVRHYINVIIAAR
jgi:hypothetical protein